MIVATKCDVPENQREVDIASVTRMAAACPLCFADFRTSINAPGSQRDCLQTMLKAIIANRRGKSGAQDLRPMSYVMSYSSNCHEETKTHGGRLCTCVSHNRGL